MGSVGVAECIELAGMKAEGKSLKELAILFGYTIEKGGSCTAITNQVALGKALASCPQTGKYHERVRDIPLRDAIRYLIPLRIESLDGERNSYDYTEVHLCIDKLISGEIDREKLPTYSAERRVEIVK